MSVRVFIDGAEGTTGLEIRERLADRADVIAVTLEDDRRKDPAARAEALNAADAVILCLPDAAAREAVAMIAAPDVRVIDASTAHRIDPAWTYGFAELEPDRRAALGRAVRVANPGCYPTGYLALVRPLVRAGWLPPNFMAGVNAVSGYSGGGKAMIAAFGGAAGAPTAFRPYALALGHKHVPEMRHHAGQEAAPIFAPAVANVYRGMLVEVPLPAAALGGRTAADVRALYAETYADDPLVQVGPADLATLDIERCAGSDRLELFAFGDDTQLRLVAALDNLGKGAAGAAVQNLNLMFGLGETTGLHV